MNGELVGSYRITGTLSVGGMGSIYTAEHTLIGRKAAVKMLLPEFSQNRDIVQRFFNEAKATAAIRHPGIVEIFDFGYHTSGQAYLVMELLDGEPLSSRIARSPIEETIALGMIRSTIGALAAAHALGVVHRDLKPDNIFLVRDPDVPGGERPKVLDFGIAKLADTGGTGNATRTGIVMGTPRYMSPEQCRGSGAIDARADLYAIGCIFYEMLCGRPPFIAEGSGELIASHMMVPPDPPRAYNPNISLEVEEVILRLLAKSPDARYASASDLLVALGGTPVDASGRSVALITPAVLTPMGSLANRSGVQSGIRSGVRSPSGVGGVPTPVPAHHSQPTTMSNANGAVSQISAPPKKKRTGLFVGIGAVVVAGAVVAVIAATGGGSTPAASSTAAATAPAATPGTTPPTTPPVDPKAATATTIDPKAATATADVKTADPKAAAATTIDVKTTDPKAATAATGDPKAATATTGDPKAAAATAGDPKAATTGDPKAATTTGDPKAATTTGDAKTADAKTAGAKTAAKSTAKPDGLAGIAASTKKPPATKPPATKPPATKPPATKTNLPQLPTDLE